MKRKLCLGLAMLLLLLPLTVFLVQGETADATQWAVIQYSQEPDTEEEQPKVGTLSFDKNAKNYMRRYTMLSWDVQALEVRVNNELCAQGTYYLWKAGEYTVSVKNVASGESVTCRVTMLPVIKMSGQYLVASSSTGEFFGVVLNYYPVVVCENVDKMELDIGMESVNRSFQSGMSVDTFGRHSLKFSSGSYAQTVYFDVFACTA